MLASNIQIKDTRCNFKECVYLNVLLEAISPFAAKRMHFRVSKQ